MYELLFVELASQELAQEAKYSARQWGQQHAKKYFQELKQRIVDLTSNQKQHRLYQDVLPGLRIMRFKGSQVFYVIDEDNKRVIVLAVLSIYRQLSESQLSERLNH